ncbi:unnamed protein product, partial [Mesorhabditis spiculigera]
MSQNFDLVKYKEKRPGTGSLGTPIELTTNLFKMIFPQDNINQKFPKYLVELSTQKKAGLEPIKTREGRRRAFWFIVARNLDTFIKLQNVIYDDFINCWAYDGIRPPRKVEIRFREWRLKEQMPGSLLRPEKPGQGDRNETVVMDIKEATDVCRDTSIGVQTGPWDEVRAGEAMQLVKALLLQKHRFVPDVCEWEWDVNHPRTPKETSDFCTLLRTLGELFYAHQNSIYRVPKDPTKYPGFDAIITPGTHAWIGTYHSLKYIEGYQPVVNFGLVNKLFMELDMPLPLFWMTVIHQKRENPGPLPELTEQQLKDASMNVYQCELFNRVMKGLRLKAAPVAVFEPFNRKTGRGNCWDVVTRHYKFTELAKVRRLCEIGRDIQWGKTAALMRVSYNKTWITLEQLYQNAALPLKWPNLPLAVVEVGNKFNVVPLEMLRTHDSPQVYNKILNYKSQQKYIKACSRPALDMRPVNPDSSRPPLPVSHKQLTEMLVKKLEVSADEGGYPKDPFLQHFGISINPKGIECEGRVLEPPNIQANDEVLVATKEDHRGFSLRKFLSPPPQKVEMAVIVMYDNGEPVHPLDDVKGFYNQLAEICAIRGVAILEGLPKKCSWDVSRDPGGLPCIARTLADKANKECCYCVLIFGDRDFGRYGHIKEVMDFHGIVSQCIDIVTVKKFKKNPKKHTIFYNLSMKINQKLGGITHGLAEEVDGDEMRKKGLLFIDKEHPTMFIGIDVTHPPVENKKDPELRPSRAAADAPRLSIAALVTNTNLEATRYTAEVLPQYENQECVVHLEETRFCNLVNKFCESTGTVPKHLVVIRDGVSDGQLMPIASAELKWMKATWKTKYPGHQITFTYIVVQKRHFVRFYPKKKEEAEGPNGNIPAGTIIDTTVVHPDIYDFYLASHYGNAGTTRPPRFIVLLDEWKLDVDEMQKMLNNLCYIFARCARPISLPAPLYYAHLICAQAKERYRSLVMNDEIDPPPSSSDSGREGGGRGKNQPKTAEVWEDFIKLGQKLTYKVEGMPWL